MAVTDPSSGSFPAEIQLTANEQSLDTLLNRAVATGKVRALLAGGRILADRIEYDAISGTLYASGTVRFQRGNQYLQASRLRYNLNDQRGEAEEVYGYLDLEQSKQDLDLEAIPSLPLGPEQPMACPPKVPPVPNWHPYPWAATLWAGQAIDTNFGQTFVFQGRMRPEYLLGIGLNRRLYKAGPFALEFDSTLMGHRANPDRGGGFNQAVPFSTNPGQTYAELTAGIGIRAWLLPRLSVAFVQGVSLLSENSLYEKTYRENFTQFLNYLGFEIEALVSPQWSVVGRIHHRSGAYGLYSGVSEGSNAYLLGLRYRFGRDSGQNEPLQVALAPPLGCPDPDRGNRQRVRTLAEALEQVAMGPAPSGAPSPPRNAQGSSTAPSAPGSGQATKPLTPSEQNAARTRAIEQLDQRIGSITQRQGVTAGRRFGTGSNSFFTASDTEVSFGGVRPPQIQTQNTADNKKLVSGTVGRWRFQAAKLTITPDGWQADRIGMTNDPFTPVQAWLDAENVVARQEPNGDILLSADRNRLILEDQIPIPVSRNQRIQKKQEVENRWVLGNDGEDRDGNFVGRQLRPIKIGSKGELALQPQFLWQRARLGTTDSYVLPGQSAGAEPSSQPAEFSDLFGLVATYKGPVLGFTADANLSISTFNPKNLANGTRSWGDLSRSIALPVVGLSTARVFGAYRYRTWNGSLGEQDVYSAYGVSLEQRGNLPNWGRLSSSYIWRLGVGSFQSNQFESINFTDLWRGSGVIAINSSLPVWTGKPLPLTATGAYRNVGTAIVPGLTFNTNLTVNMAYYGTGAHQNLVSLSAGPTLTLGHFSKPFLDYTQLTITGGGSLRNGLSPFSFDRAVDLATIGVGLSQQIYGPLVLSGGIGVNVDGRSANYGDLTGSYVELKWQRRAYEFSVYYSPYERLGGVRVKLNDFSFTGTGVPFVPVHPGTDVGERPF
ncbi:DUF3769 domain-containing protein [Cyanobium sp. Morenito 9A2]|uniref:DUF3769 domain-containing protein n=1 Tax=Cyanobium sp. Morenito 9A2 TaxID=2823718 RepID=UPI0020CD35B9|nr:DUF3769 domain-containing protein [Cyanobium sp. Morenito 9A2]MCP9849640.1 DUF3769 domain-containing protein [Cyanobium sp. Morenito 9A2]